MNQLTTLLLEAPDSQLDESAKKIIRKWPYQPTALNVLEVLDHCVYGGSASDFTMSVLHILLDTRIEEEQTTLEEVVKHATWRTE